MAQSIVGALRVVLGLDAAEFHKGLVAAQGEMKKIGKELSRLGGEMMRAGQGLTLGLSAPLLAMGVQSIRTAAQFESAMIRVKIATSATGKEMQALQRLARDIGRDTIFSASQAAEAMEELAKTGVSTSNILNGAARATVDLAAATGSELVPAAGAITDVMTLFGKQAKDLPRVVDQITGSVNASKFEFADFQLAMAQGGGRAAMLGVTFEDFTAALAGTAAQFTSGSDAGTSFGTFLQRLVPGSKEAEQAMKKLGFSFYTAEGQLRPMSEIAEELNQRFGKLNNEELSGAMTKIFGADAFRTAAGLARQGAKGLDEVAASIAKVDAAAQAAERMKGFNGQLEQMGGAAEELAIRIGETGLLGAVTKIIQGIGGFVEAVGKLPTPLLAVGLGVAGVAAAIGPAILLSGAFAASLGALATASANSAVSAGVLSVALRGLSASMKFLMGPWGIAIMGIATAVGVLAARAREATPAQKSLDKATSDLAGASRDYEQAALLAASATGEGKKAALEEARARRVNAVEILNETKQKIANAKASLAQAAAARQAYNARLANAGEGMGTYARVSSRGPRTMSGYQEDSLRASMAEAEKLAKETEATINRIDAGLAAPLGGLGGGGGGGLGADTGGSGGGSSSSRDEAQRRARAIEDMRHEVDLQDAQFRNDQDRVRILEREDAVRQRTRALIDAGIVKDAAAAKVEAERVEARLDAAREAASLREIKDDRRDLDRRLWEIDGRGDMVQKLEREAQLQERIAFWQRQHRDLVTATATAVSEMAELDKARADAAERTARSAARQLEIEKARLSGDTRGERRLNREADVEDRTRAYMTRENNPLSPEDARRRAEADVAALDDAELQGKYRSFVKGGWRAALDGDLGSFMKDWFKNWSAKGLEDGLNSLGDLLKRLFQSFDLGKLGSGGGGFNLSGITNTFSSMFAGFKLPGFANGGSIMPGGSGGIDSQVVAFRKSPSERVDIYTPGNDVGPGGGPHFDLRGAVMTEDLLAQMRTIGRTSEDRAYGRAVKDVPALAQSQTAKQQQHAVGRRRR